MDPTMDTINDSSSVSSLASAFSHLEMDSSPINRLPNELMQQILAKLALDDDVNKLVRFRLVSSRWNLLVLDYCKQNKSLIVNYRHSRFSPPDLAKSAPMIVAPISVASLVEMLKLFPNTVQLSISLVCRLDNYDIPSLVKGLESLQSLKQLSLYGHLVQTLPYLYKVLPKLDHIEVDAFNGILSQEELRRLVTELVQHSARVFFGGLELHFGQILQWRNINREWLANVTHLQVNISNGQKVDYVRVLHLFGEHATSLQHLEIAFCDHTIEMTVPVIDDLAKLVRLTHLALGRVEFDIAALKQAVTQHRLTAVFNSVLTCKLELRDGPNSVNEDQFTRVLFAIFPNMTNLNLEIFEDATARRGFLRQIGRNLRRMPQLRKYKVEFK